MDYITLEELGQAKFLTAMMNYPIQNEDYRETLNNNIYQYYKHYTISLKDQNKWLSILVSRMAVIMPRYNLLYKSIDLQAEINPLLNFDKQRTVDHKGADTRDKSANTNDVILTTGEIINESTASGTGKSKESNNENTRYSDTPQGNLAVPPNTTSMGYYATNATYTNGETETNSENNSSATGKSTSTDNKKSTKDVTENEKSSDTYNDSIHEWGTAPGSNYSKLLSDYRELALNVDQAIIDNLGDLFFSVWNPFDYL